MRLKRTESGYTFMYLEGVTDKEVARAFEEVAKCPAAGRVHGFYNYGLETFEDKSVHPFYEGRRDIQAFYDWKEAYRIVYRFFLTQNRIKKNPYIEEFLDIK